MRREEDLGLTTGRTPFLADLPFDGLHAVFVRSMIPHRVVRSSTRDSPSAHRYTTATDSVPSRARRSARSA